MSDDPFAVQDPFKNPSPYANGVVPQQQGPVRQDETGALISSAGWREPPLRTPQPSFMDHRGLDRVGVLTHMQPLGSRPPKHIRSSGRVDPLGRYRRGRTTLGTGGTDSARATPDHASESSAMAASGLHEDLSPQSTPLSDTFPSSLRHPVPRDAVALDDDDEDYPDNDPPHLGHGGPGMLSTETYMTHVPPIDPELFEPGEYAMEQPEPAMGSSIRNAQPVDEFPSPMDVGSPLQMRTRQHSESKVPAFLQLSGATVSDKIESAIFLSNRRRPDLHAMITHLHSAILKDAELGALMAVNAEGPTNEHARRLLRKKIGRVKRAVLIDDFSPTRTRRPRLTSITNLPASPTLLPTTPLASPDSDPEQSDIMGRRRTTPATAPEPTRRSARQASAKVSKSQEKPPVVVASAGSSKAKGRGPVLDLKRAFAEASARNKSASSSLSPANEEVPKATGKKTGQASKLGKRLHSSIEEDDEEAAAPAVESKRQKSKALQTRISNQAGLSDTRSTIAKSANPLQPASPSEAGTPPAATYPKTLDLRGGKKRKSPAEEPEQPEGAPAALGHPSKRARTTGPAKLNLRSSKPAGSVGRSLLGGEAAAPAAATEPAAAQEPAAALLEESDSFNSECDVCGEGGSLVCCDGSGCDRVYHATCLTPPLDAGDLPSKFYCPHCQTAGKKGDNLFGPLLHRMEKTKPANEFALPGKVRGQFKGVGTGPKGEFREQPPAPSKKARPGAKVAAELPHNTFAQHNADGSIRTCYACGKMSDGKRHVVPCDFCQQSFHTDCLDPPLTERPNYGNTKRIVWMCPLHIDKDLQNIDPVQGNGVVPQGPPKTHRSRQRKNQRTRATAAPRGHQNNGQIEIVNSSDDEGFLSEEADGSVPRLPASAVKLNFIEAVKTNQQRDFNEDQAEAVRLTLQREKRQLELQEMIMEKMEREDKVSRLLVFDLERRDYAESDAALQLVKLSKGSKNAAFASDNISNLIMTLRDQAPPEIYQSRSGPEPPVVEAPEVQLEHLKTLRNLIDAREAMLKKQMAADKLNKPHDDPTGLDAWAAEQAASKTASGRPARKAATRKR